MRVKTALLALAVMTLGVVAFTPPLGPTRAATLVTMDKSIEQQELGNLVVGLISVANPKLSAPRKQILARTFVRVASDIFDKQEDRREFAFVVLAESSYNPNIQDSSAGAVGVSQLLPQYAREFGKLCNITGFTTEDLRADVELNLTVGACLFRSLIEEFKGNSALAHASYIAGKDSLAVRELKSMRNVSNLDVASYLAKFFYLKEEAKSK